MMEKYSDEKMGPVLRYVNIFNTSDEFTVCRIKFRIIDRELIKEDGTRVVSVPPVLSPPLPVYGKIKGVIVNLVIAESRSNIYKQKTNFGGRTVIKSS